MEKTDLRIIRPPESSRPTLKTVAKACGLAVTTVSRALNNAEDIALSTRKRVKQVANDLGYVPNSAGRGLRTGKTHTIILVLSDPDSSGYSSGVISGLAQSSRNNGYETSATLGRSSANPLDAIKSIVENRRADGIVISRTEPQDIRVKYLLENGFPFVSHGRTELATPHAFVDFDNQKFAELAVSRLAKRGRKKLLLVGGPIDLTYAQHLKIGFQRGVLQNGLDQDARTRELNIDTPLSHTRSTIKRLCENNEHPDGIVSAGDMQALAIMAGIRDAGLEPGVDVDIVTKQISQTLEYLSTAIDVCYEDANMTGFLLGETLFNVIKDNESLEERNHIIAPEIRHLTGA